MQGIKPSVMNMFFALAKVLAVSLFCGVFLWIIGDILIQSVPHFSWDYIWSAPSQAGRTGGIRPIIISTLYILIICLSLVIPISLLSGLFFSSQLVPLPHVFKPFYLTVDVLAGVPSVVFGLFGNTYFCNYLNLGYSILAGGLTLACMILPLTIKLIEASFRSIPRSYIESGEALGLSHGTIFIKIMIPAILPQCAGAIILSLGRAMAETAALLFTSGYVLRDPLSIFDSGRTLSIHIYDMSMNVTGANESAYKSALVLLTLIGLINLMAHIIVKKWAKTYHGH